MATCNRGYLLKLAKAGKLVMAESYSFDDMSGEERCNREMPVAIKEPSERSYDGKTCFLTDWDFQTKSGHAYYGENKKLVHMRVHSNCYYDFKILD